MKPSRRRSRELALQGIYQWLYTGQPAREVLKHLAELEGYGGADEQFLKEALAGTIKDEKALREKVEPLADRKWDDVSPVERGILLLAAWEMVHQPDIPYRVTINEAIELGKRFGGTDGHKYVNGVLDRLAGNVRPDEVAEKRTEKRKPRNGKR